MPSHETRLRVRYAETDQMGVVYYANYLVWMEVGRVELVRSLGVEYKKVEERGLYLSVIEANCRYVSPAKYDDEVVVKTQVARSSSRIVEFAYEIRTAEDWRLLAEGRTRHIWLNKQWKPVSLPEEFRKGL